MLPGLIVKLLKLASLDFARVTITVYVLVFPFCAVTFTGIVCATPGLKPISVDALPDGTVVPLIITEANELLVVGVKAILVVLFGTLIEYRVVYLLKLILPLLNAKLLNVASDDACTVTFRL